MKKGIIIETLEKNIIKDINHNKKIIKYHELYSVKNIIIKLLLKSGIILDYAYPYILSGLIMLNIGFYKKNKPFNYDQTKKTYIENIYNSNNEIEINYNNDILYNNDCLIYTTPFKLEDGKYTAKEITFSINKNIINKYNISSILKMNYEQIKSLFKIDNIKTIYRNNINSNDNQITIVLHDETIPLENIRKIDTYSILFIILVLLQGLGISKINKIIFKNYIRNKLNELDENLIIYGKREIYMLNEIIKNEYHNLEYINNNNYEKPKLRIEYEINMKKELLSENKNNYFSEFTKEDLNLLYNTIQNLLIEYRYNLGITKEPTFGIEIEYEGLYYGKTGKFLNKNFNNWESKVDSSLYFGGEITSPVMIDDKEFWIELKKVCNFLKKHQAKVRNNAGGHVHIGANLFNNDKDLWILFLKLYVCYEHILYRFGYGECINGRKVLYAYSKFSGKELYSNIKILEKTNQIEDFQYILDERKQKFDGINFKHVLFDKTITNKYNTIEFRFPNGTKNEIIWQNNINVFSKMISAIASNKINPEFIEYKFNEYKEQMINPERLSDLICLEDAFEFADLIFDNNLDKMYFLKQYFHNFEYTISKRPSILSKKITLNH